MEIETCPNCQECNATDAMLDPIDSETMLDPKTLRS